MFSLIYKYYNELTVEIQNVLHHKKGVTHMLAVTQNFLLLMLCIIAIITVMFFGSRCLCTFSEVLVQGYYVTDTLDAALQRCGEIQQYRQGV